MDFVQDTDILQVIRSFNPWWREPSFTTGLPFHRMAFHETYKWFTTTNLRRAILISGARRVGKTVILRQIVERLITEGLDGREVLYLTLDHPILKLAGLDRIIGVYRQNVAPGSKGLILLLDEVQYADDWGTWIKHRVDFDPAIRIIATGSAALDIREEGTESGVGRWLTIKVPTLSFYEYLCIKNVSLPDLPLDLKVLNIPSMSKPEMENLLNLCLPVKTYFHRFLLSGGFPELVSISNVEDVQRLLREDVVDKVLKRDMTAAFGVRSVLEIERLFIYLCLHSGGIIEKKTVASNMGVSLDTVDRFLNHLEAANLIYRLYPFKQEGKRLLKGRPKIYVADTSLRNAVLLKNEDILTNTEELGLSVEGAVYKHFYTCYYRIEPLMGYWRSPKQGGKEVDLIIKFEDQIIPVEVKYREDARLSDKDGLWIFTEASRSQRAVLVTKDEKDFKVVDGPGGATILIIPAFLLLFLLGHSERAQIKAV